MGCTTVGVSTYTLSGSKQSPGVTKTPLEPPMVPVDPHRSYSVCFSSRLRIGKAGPSTMTCFSQDTAEDGYPTPGTTNYVRSIKTNKCQVANPLLLTKKENWRLNFTRQKPLVTAKFFRK